MFVNPPSAQPRPAMPRPHCPAPPQSLHNQMYDRSRLSQVRNELHVCFLTQLLPLWKAEICLRPHLAAQRRRLADGGRPIPPTAELRRAAAAAAWWPENRQPHHFSIYADDTHLLVEANQHELPAWPRPFHQAPPPATSKLGAKSSDQFIITIYWKNRKHLMFRRSTCTAVCQ